MKTITHSLPLPTLARRLASAFLIGSALTVSASTVTLDFDSFSPGTAGIDPTAYFAGYGITLTGAGTAIPVIYSDLDFYGSGVVDASSGHNFLLQQYPSAGNGFTLNFATGLTNLQFTRIANVAFNLVGTWSATAYSGAFVVGSVSEPFGLGPFSPATYSFSGSNITSLVISASGFGVAGITSVMMDDLILTTVDTVPDQAGTLGLLGASLLLLSGIRRRFAR